jgi:hypothetical protein
VNPWFQAFAFVKWVNLCHYAEDIDMKGKRYFQVPVLPAAAAGGGEVVGKGLQSSTL